MPAPETKYTDRDVRENDGLEERVYQYLEGYCGEFQFLVDAKMRLEYDGELPTPIIRGVLNCMRVDVRVTDLPKPLPYQPAEVIPMERTESHARRIRRERNKRKVCTRTDPHPYHGGFGEENDFCDGVYLINRVSYYTMEARVKPEYRYVVARTGAKIHGVTSAVVMWYPNIHKTGWNRSPKLIVKLHCRYPSTLVDPRLMDEMTAKGFTDLFAVPFCLHCFPEDFPF